MSIENVLTAALFKRDDAGRTIVYPSGAMGSGYIVPDADTEQKMRRKLMWAILCAGASGGSFMAIMMPIYSQVYDWTAAPWITTAVFLVATHLVHRAAVKRLASGLTPIAERMGMIEALERQAEALPRWYLWFMLIAAPLYVVGSVAWMIVSPSMTAVLIALAAIALFGTAGAQAIHGLKHRRRCRDEDRLRRRSLICST
jgi:hypothetical protein